MKQWDVLLQAKFFISLCPTYLAGRTPGPKEISILKNWIEFRFGNNIVQVCGLGICNVALIFLSLRKVM
jgi:hypothetical protein